MFKRIFYHPSVSAIADWATVLGLVGGALAIVFAGLVKITPEWFGQLTWPQTILLGFGLSAATLLTFAATAGLFAYSFRRVWPAASVSAITLPMEPALSESEIALAGCRRADGSYDYAKLRSEMDRITDPNREHIEAWAEAAGEVEHAQPKPRLTDTDRERCAETLRDVHDFIGDCLVPFERVVAVAAMNNDHRVVIGEMPDLIVTQDQLQGEATLLWHRHRDYLDLMDLDLGLMMHGIQQLRNPLKNAWEAKDWPPKHNLNG